MAYDLSKLEIAIIDPNTFSRQLLRALLNAIGIPTANIKELDDAESALADLNHFMPDLILCEITLPRMDGIGFIQSVRQLEDEVKRYLPIIVCTGHTDQQQVLACRDAGAHELLIKPMSVKTLYQRIVSVIEHPRSFIYTPIYTGPDRRRRDAGHASQARRGSDAGS